MANGTSKTERRLQLALAETKGADVAVVRGDVQNGRRSRRGGTWCLRSRRRRSSPAEFRLAAGRKRFLRSSRRPAVRLHIHASRHSASVRPTGKNQSARHRAGAAERCANSVRRPFYVPAFFLHLAETIHGKTACIFMVPH